MPDPERQEPRVALEAAGEDARLRQDGYDVRLEWGPHGLRRLAPVCSVIVIVDVLSFTSSVSMALEAGAVVYPYKWADDGAAAYAAERGAMLAGHRQDPDAEVTLSPPSLGGLAAGTKVVLPSPNGSALSFAARAHGATHVFAACLRNASAVAAAVAKIADGPIGIIPAGERWRGGTGPMRVALEDLLGAGAVVHRLGDALVRSPEAAAAAAAFADAEPHIHERIADSPSGRELIGGGFRADVVAATSLDVASVAPRLVDDVYLTDGSL